MSNPKDLALLEPSLRSFPMNRMSSRIRANFGLVLISSKDTVAAIISWKNFFKDFASVLQLSYFFLLLYTHTHTHIH